tara:strand:+ start:455 stop:631 length:177 start_codon:yes stop_codon:yes gene_type:complete
MSELSQFIDDVFEIAFGDSELKKELLRDKEYDSVLTRLRYYSDKALEADPELVDCPDN